jgi:hypothetical protein
MPAPLTGTPRPGGAADQEHSQVPAVGLVLLRRRGGGVVSGATPTVSREKHNRIASSADRALASRSEEA